MASIEKQSINIKGGSRPGAGRKKGTPNKRTSETVRAVEASGITPLEYMLQVMRSEAPACNDAKVMMDHTQMKFEAAKAAAPYIHPRLAAIEHTGDGGGPIDHSLTVTFK